MFGRNGWREAEKAELWRRYSYNVSQHCKKTDSGESKRGRERERIIKKCDTKNAQHNENKREDESTETTEVDKTATL